MLTRTAIVETVGIKKKRGFCAIISTNALVQSARITLAQLVLAEDYRLHTATIVAI